MNNNTLFIDMDGCLCDYVSHAMTYMSEVLVEPGSEEYMTAINDCQYIEGFFRSIEPMPGAIDAYHKLCDTYDVYILSAPSWDNISSWSDKRLWVGQHLGKNAYKKLILSHNKGHFTGRALIDDRIKYGVDKFNGEHIHFGTDKFPDWSSVLNHLL